MLAASTLILTVCNTRIEATWSARLVTFPEINKDVLPKTWATSTIRKFSFKNNSISFYCNELISDVLLWTPTHGRAKAGRPARTYIQQLCDDTGCKPGDLPEAMNNREGWRESVSDIHAGGMTRWWWIICKSKNVPHTWWGIWQTLLFYVWRFSAENMFLVLSLLLSSKYSPDGKVLF